MPNHAWLPVHHLPHLYGAAACTTAQPPMSACSSHMGPLPPSYPSHTLKLPAAPQSTCCHHCTTSQADSPRIAVGPMVCASAASPGTPAAAFRCPPPWSAHAACRTGRTHSTRTCEHGHGSDMLPQCFCCAVATATTPTIWDCRHHHHRVALHWSHAREAGGPLESKEQHVVW